MIKNMFVDSLSAAEMIKQLNSDLIEIEWHIITQLTKGNLEKERRHYFKKINSRERKSRFFSKEIEYKSVRENKWQIKLTIHHKFHYWSGFTKINSKDPSIIYHLKGGDYIFSGHFLSRFNQRFLTETELIIENIKEYFLSRDIFFIPLHKYLGEIQLSETFILMKEGAGLGKKIEIPKEIELESHPDLGVCVNTSLFFKINTFIIYEQMKKSQLNKIFEDISFLQDERQNLLRSTSSSDERYMWKIFFNSIDTIKPKILAKLSEYQ